MAGEPERVVRDYFAALARRDLEAARAHLAPQLRGTMHGLAEFSRAGAVVDWFTALFAAAPDFTFEVRRTVSEGEEVAVHWRATGTFTGAAWNGLQATGARLDFQGVDVITVRDGLIVDNDAFADGLTAYRQLGALPPAGSATEARMTTALNTRTRVSRRAGAGSLEPVADAILGAAAPLGGLKRVVLSHAHPGHRGAAPRLGVPVLCHPDARAEAEGDGGRSYFDFSKLPIPARWTLPVAVDLWDGGPVEIAETVGEEVAGFRVVEIPGHAPGQIALVRDGLALTADAFYVVDVAAGRPRPPGLPETAFNQDEAAARESVRRLAALDLREAWPGHGEPLRGDVRAQLERVR